MTETLRFALIGKEDLKIGTSSFEVRLGDGRVVTLSEIRLTDFLSALTLGSVLFVKAGGVAGEDNANLFYDDANNRLGIGTASPSQPLHVVGIILGTQNVVFRSGTAFDGTLDHAITAARTWTLPDSTDTVVLLAATQTLTNKTLTDPVISAEDARTNTVDVPLTIRSTTTGTPAANIGTGILVQAESADESPSDFGQIEFAASDVAINTEDTYFQVLLRVAGAALTAVYRFVATGAFKAIFSHTNTADRTYTLPDSTGTIVVDGAALGTSAPATPTANALYRDSLVKGWVVFDLTGAIDDDLNVSSVTDNGVGDWTVNWATAFAGAGYTAIP